MFLKIEIPYTVNKFINISNEVQLDYIYKLEF